MKQPKEKLSFKVSLLSLSLFLMMAPQIASAIPLMYEAFPKISKAAIETLVTIPNFGIMAGLFLSPIVIRYIGQKKTILSGLIVALVAGTFPIYADQYVLMLISRFLVGVGIGLFNSLAVSLIPQFYQDSEDECASMLGFQNVMGSIGAALFSFLVGYLVTVSWHAAFAIFFLIIPVLIAFTIFVPLDEGGSQTQRGHKEKQEINGKVTLIASLMFTIFLLFMPVTFKIPSLIVQERMGDLSTSALISGVTTLIGIPIGASFGLVFKVLRDKIFPLGFLIVTCGFLVVSLSSQLWLLIVGVLLIGLGFGLAIPYMYNWLGWAAPQGSINLATTLVLIMVNIGCFLSPSLMGFLSGFLSVTDARAVFYVSTIGFALIFIYSLFHYVKVHKLVV